VGSETDPRDQRIAERTQLLAAALSRIKIAEKRVAEWEAELARLRQNSSHSSKPPSSDLLGVELALGSVCNIEREVSLARGEDPSLAVDCVETAGHRFSNCEEPRRGDREAVAWRVLRWISRR